jgi:hypothetical protein
MAASRFGGLGPVPPQMAAMAAASGLSVAALPEAELAELAALCTACPRTDACRLWLVAHAVEGPAAAPDLCPNHAHFRALAGDDRLA